MNRSANTGPKSRADPFWTRHRKCREWTGHEPPYVIQTRATFVAESRKEFLRNSGWGFSDVDALMVAFIKGKEIKEDDKDRQPFVLK